MLYSLTLIWSVEKCSQTIRVDISILKLYTDELLKAGTQNLYPHYHGKWVNERNSSPIVEICEFLKTTNYKTKKGKASIDFFFHFTFI